MKEIHILRLKDKSTIICDVTCMGPNLYMIKFAIQDCLEHLFRPTVALISLAEHMNNITMAFDNLLADHPLYFSFEPGTILALFRQYYEAVVLKKEEENKI